MVWSYKRVGKVGASPIFYKESKTMKFYVYTIYFNRDKQESYLFRSKAKKMVKEYQYYFEDTDIYYIKEEVYV